MSEVIRIQSTGRQITPPAAPVVTQPAPMVTPIPTLQSLAAMRDRAAIELATIEQAERDRLNAEAKAAQTANELRQRITDLDRQAAAQSASLLVQEATTAASNAPQALNALYTELESVVSAIQAVQPFIQTIEGISARHTQIIQEAAGAAVSTVQQQGNWTQETTSARQKASQVLAEVRTVPLTRNAAIKQWISQATSEREQTARVGIALALTGILFKDIPKDYRAEGEAWEVLRGNVIPQF